MKTVLTYTGVFMELVNWLRTGFCSDLVTLYNVPEKRGSCKVVHVIPYRGKNRVFVLLGWRTVLECRINREYMRGREDQPYDFLDFLMYRVHKIVTNTPLRTTAQDLFALCEMYGNSGSLSPWHVWNTTGEMLEDFLDLGTYTACCDERLRFSLAPECVSVEMLTYAFTGGIISQRDYIERLTKHLREKTALPNHTIKFSRNSKR